jgi:ankyrin repeat protein
MMAPPDWYGDWWDQEVAALPEAERPGAEYRARLCAHVHRAVRLNDIEAMGWLLAAGVSPEAEGWHEGPLYEAAEAGRTELVEFLVAHGAKTDSLSPHERAKWRRGEYTSGDPLVGAAKEGRVETLACLLRAEQDRGEIFQLRLADAMRVAIDERHTEAVRVLLSSGADPNLAPLHDPIPPMKRARWNDEIVALLTAFGGVSV